MPRPAAPYSSKEYPNRFRFHVLNDADPDPSLKDLTVNPLTKDVCVWKILEAQRVTVGFIWDILGFLDVLYGEQGVDSTTLNQVNAQVQKIQADVNTLLNLMTVTVPLWLNKDAVLNGLVSPWGVKQPSAAELGLTVEFVVDAARHESPGLITSMTPPPGTVVLRGSKVTVAHEAEE